MNASRITAVVLVLAAAGWIASGHMKSDADTKPADTKAADQAKPEKLFRVAVQRAELQQHQRTLTLSGRTEADKKVTVMARTGGVVTKLDVRRGSHVKKGDVIAVLSDDAREAQVAQAQALFEQRKDELSAKKKLIEMGSMPRLELGNLQSQYKAAQAALAAAVAEQDRGIVRAPWDGIVTDVPIDVGQAAFSFMGQNIAQMVSLDPMLAVVEVSERKLAGLTVGTPAEVRLISGQTAQGRIRYVSKSASDKTRTYRVEVEIPNKDGKIPDGITCEVNIKMAPVEAVRLPRSALTFSSAGDLGVRTVDDNGLVAFVPVDIAEDEQNFMWVNGVARNAQVIVEGQDFVREGEKVDIAAPAERTARQ